MSFQPCPIGIRHLSPLVLPLILFLHISLFARAWETFCLECLGYVDGWGPRTISNSKLDGFRADEQSKKSTAAWREVSVD